MRPQENRLIILKKHKTAASERVQLLFLCIYQVDLCVCLVFSQVFPGLLAYYGFLVCWYNEDLDC